jgi:DNA-binding transcriptional LysR family regulator
MELRQLKYFERVCQLGNISKAAEQLHIAQPAVSIAMQKLEEELGVHLFDRSRKKISLTPAGLIFSHRVKVILGQIQNSITEMDDFGKLQHQTIRIGITPMLGAFLFPYIFSKVRQENPDLELIVIEEGSLTINNLLEQGKLDIGITMISNVSSELKVDPIATIELLVCLSRKHPLSRTTRLPFSALMDQPLILFNEESYSRQLILQECEKHHFTPNIVFSSSQIETIIGLVENTVGISFLLAPIAHRHPEVTSRSLIEPIFVQAGLAWNKNRYLSSASRSFIKSIQSYSFRQDDQSCGYAAFE